MFQATVLSNLKASKATVDNPLHHDDNSGIEMNTGKRISITNNTNDSIKESLKVAIRHINTNSSDDKLTDALQVLRDKYPDIFVGTEFQVFDNGISPKEAGVDDNSNSIRK